jgi:hypothetical protein
VQVWCDDFLGLGNITRPASCCHKDDTILLDWCSRPGASNDTRYSEVCDPWSHEFGTTNWAVGDDGMLRLADPSIWQDVQDESSFCEVLGKACCCFLLVFFCLWLQHLRQNTRSSCCCTLEGARLHRSQHHATKRQPSVHQPSVVELQRNHNSVFLQSSAFQM